MEIWPGDEDLAILNDPVLFNFGNNWGRAYSLLPELAAPSPDRTNFAGDDQFREVIKAVEDMACESGEEEHHLDDYEEELKFHAVMGVTWLVVADGESFKGD